MASKDEQKLSNFAEELEGLLDDYRSDQILNQQTKSHQRTLEKLLGKTNKILEGTASDQDHEQFDELVKYSKRSYKEVQKQNRNNEEFQQSFEKKFGEGVGAGSLSRRVMDNLSTNLSEVASSVQVLNKNAAQDVSDTALNFATGPFGAMIKESLDLSGITGFIKKKFSGGGDTAQSGIKGQFDAGINRVPSRGTYILDKNERVIPPEQNKDLSQFLNAVGDTMNKGQHDQGNQSEKDRVVRIFNNDSSPDYWEPLKSHNEQLHSQTLKTLRTGTNKTINELQWLRRMMSQETQDQIDAWLQSFSLFYQRFARHPILNTLRLAMKPLGWFFSKGWELLFGKRKSETDRIVESNERITEFLRKGFSDSRKTAFQRGIRNTGRGIASLGSRALGMGPIQSAQELEDKRSRGESLGRGRVSRFFNERRLDKAQPYITQKSFGAGIGGSGFGGSQRKSKILAGDERREQDQMEEDVTGIRETLNEIKELIEGYKGFGSEEKTETEKGGRGIAGTLSSFLKGGVLGAGHLAALGAGKIVAAAASGIGALGAALGMGALGTVGVMALLGISAYGIYKLAKQVWDKYWDESETDKKVNEIMELRARRDAAEDAGNTEKAKELQKRIDKLQQDKSPNALSREDRYRILNKDGTIPYNPQSPGVNSGTAATARQFREAGRNPDGSLRQDMLPADDRVLEEQRNANKNQETGNTLLESIREQLEFLNKEVRKKDGGENMKGQKGSGAHPATQRTAGDLD